MIAKRWIIGCWIVTMGGCLMACAPQAVREAEDVVVQADSLWHDGKQYGIDEGDSATLAQAYKTLEAIHLPFREGLGVGSPYAHACYHYGKLLRAKGNPAEAMQAFIAATHSGTKDYHILGRVYSNMGSICHLAGEFQLSYDMYEKSADMFIRNGDTLAFYYAYNDMAFELAEQGKKESLALLDTVIHSCGDEMVIVKTWETKAEFFIRTAQYDSAISCINYLGSLGVYEPTSMLIKAQAFDDIGQKDSALFYSNIILSASNASYQEKFNALYIVLHCDSTLDADDINSMASQREDIRYYEYEPQKEKLSQAVQLLDQDLHRKPDYRWLYAIIGVILFAGSCAILYYLWHKRKVHSRLIHDIDIKQEQKTQLESSIVAMHSEISQLSEQQQKTHQQLLSNIETTCSTLRNSKDILSELDWKDYSRMCAITNTLFNKLADSLQKMGLSEREVRLCVLVLINGYSDKQMADILCYGEKSIRGIKRYVANKLGTSSANMRVFMIELITKTT